MPTPSNYEQELLELTNRARANPMGEFDVFIADAATRTGVQANITSALNYFGVDLAAFRAQIAGLQAVAPLAWNSALAAVAETHTGLMIATDTQSHGLPGEASLGSRLDAAGYDWNGYSENVFAYGQDPLYSHAGFFIDWGYDDVDTVSGVLRADFKNYGDGIQDSIGHRNAILSASRTEIGINAQAENSSATQVGPYVITQDFGTRFGYVPQLVGVVIRDADGDAFYDAGEGMGGVTVTLRNAAGAMVASTTTWSSGGYQLELAAGSYTATFSGGGLVGEVTKSVTMGAQNLKLDVDASEAIPATAPVLQGDNTGNTLQGTAADEVLRGLGGYDWLVPGLGDDTIDGGDGIDMASFIDQTSAVIVKLNEGTVLSGPDRNVITAVENITGSIYNDYIQGDAGDNLLRGMGGYDWFVGSDGADTYDGSNGRDMVSYILASAAVTVDLGQGKGLAGQANGQTYIGIERITGSIYADIFYGSTDSDDLRGAGGEDLFYDSAGRDRYDGGASNDTVTYALSATGVRASLNLGRGGVDNDLYTSIENLVGSNRNDMLTGDAGRNALRGGHGADTLMGLGGNDVLEGGTGDDVLIGGAGYDVALYRNAASQYTVRTVGDVTTLSHITDGIDTITEVEALRFSDGFIFL